MPRTPADEDHDVIVHWCSGAWEIRLGDELHGLRFTLTSALERVRDVAAVHRKPVWLHDGTGHPLKPIARRQASVVRFPLP